MAARSTAPPSTTPDARDKTVEARVLAVSPVWLSQAAAVIRGTSAADEQLRHEPWETWRPPTVV